MDRSPGHGSWHIPSIQGEYQKLGAIRPAPAETNQAKASCFVKWVCLSHSLPLHFLSSGGKIGSSLLFLPLKILPSFKSQFKCPSSMRPLPPYSLVESFELRAGIVFIPYKDLWGRSLDSLPTSVSPRAWRNRTLSLVEP